MAKVLYFVTTLFESFLSVFGIRTPFETAPYQVVSRLAPDIEIRRYPPRMVVETTMGQGDGDAFSRLFRYITGENRDGAIIAMTTPVEMRPRDQADGQSGRMRFLLPSAYLAHPPSPADPRVTVARLPAQTVAVMRFSGFLNSDSIAAHEAMLQRALQRGGQTPASAPYVMGYDPPFTLPFFRRNEVAVDLAGAS